MSAIVFQVESDRSAPSPGAGVSSSARAAAITPAGSARIRAVAWAFEAPALVDHVIAIGAYDHFAAMGIALTIRMHSDLDVLVVHDPGVSRRECENEIRRRFDLAIGLDLILVTPEEYRTGLPATSFGRTILATAVRIDAT